MIWCDVGICCLDLSGESYTFGRGDTCDYQFSAESANTCYQAYSKVHFKVVKVTCSLHIIVWGQGVNRLHFLGWGHFGEQHFSYIACGMHYFPSPYLQIVLTRLRRGWRLIYLTASDVEFEPSFLILILLFFLFYRNGHVKFYDWFDRRTCRQTVHF